MTEEDTGSGSIKLDEILKSLFSVSARVLINMLNSLFEEDFPAETTQVSLTSNEFIDDAYNILRGDLFFQLHDTRKAHHYHIELQTLNDERMVIRMLEYGLGKAKENACHANSQAETVLHLPRQLVIFIEENRNIKDQLTLRLVLPDSQEITYRVPVMKYWEYRPQELVQKKLYPLLPLQVFKLRRRLEKIRKRTNNEAALRQGIQAARQTAQEISEEAARLHALKEIDGEDLQRILLANVELFHYLNSRYVGDEQLDQEVLKMAKTLYDPAVEERGRQEGRQEGQADLLLRLLRKKFGPVPAEVEAAVRRLPAEKLQQLAEAIFELATLEEVKAFLSGG